MELKQGLVDYSIRHYKLVAVLMVIFTLVTGAMIPFMKVDTDPENMLSKNEAVRVFHNLAKQEFALHDIVVVGIVNNKNPNGVFNPHSLSRIYELTEFSKTLRWPSENDPGEQVGVIESDLLAPSTVDYIGQGGPGVVTFEWLMNKPPTTEAEALEIRDKAMSNPLLKGTLVSEDGRAICLYLPLSSKDLSYRVYSALREKIATFTGDEQYYITGLPVAEDTFGVEMFIQMAISAPAAMLVVFLLMLLFFRKLVLVISPMIVAMVSVVSTMGLLIGFGFPVHIMSSMIPIFLMPISVVDSVHILSEFFELYTKEKGRAGTIREVMGNLFTPMLYTSLTTAAGFGSLAMTPIPPVQVFGIFVAIGVMIAWVFTVTFVPAYIMMISDKTLEGFGRAAVHTEKPGWLTRVLNRTGRFTYRAAKPILAVTAVITAVAVYGITRIQINDNPVKWFAKRHPIRQADIELNKHFGGTYMAYLVLESQDKGNVDSAFTDSLLKKWREKSKEIEGGENITGEVEKLIVSKSSGQKSKGQYLDELIGAASEKEKASSGETADLWYEAGDFFDMHKEGLKVFTRPDVLNYVAGLQEYMQQSGLVGKSNSVADVVRKVYQELTDGRPESYVIPKTSAAVAQCLLQFQSSHKPNDLWHLTTYDYTKADIWFQLRSGDNKDMERVVKEVNRYFASNKPPVPLKHDWAGLTYINTVWQDKMVFGMLQSFLGSFLIVFIMMSILFRSPLWGLVCMMPLTITIVVIYGLIGLTGKDYDMPVAVLSALTLGMAVDFAIHFLERARVSFAQTGSWQASSSEMFAEPARAISRNVVVIAVGFLPLLAAPLVPYKTVGIFMCAIMALSGLVTLMVLPSTLKLAEKTLFRREAAPMTATCNCGFCIIISTAAAVLIALNLHQNWHLPMGKLAWMSIAAIVVMAAVCGIMSRRQACKRQADGGKSNVTK